MLTGSYTFVSLFLFFVSKLIVTFFNWNLFWLLPSKDSSFSLFIHLAKGRHGRLLFLFYHLSYLLGWRPEPELFGLKVAACEGVVRMVEYSVRPHSCHFALSKCTQPPFNAPERSASPLNVHRVVVVCTPVVTGLQLLKSGSTWEVDWGRGQGLCLN